MCDLSEQQCERSRALSFNIEDSNLALVADFTLIYTCLLAHYECEPFFLQLIMHLERNFQHEMQKSFCFLKLSEKDIAKSNCAVKNGAKFNYFFKMLQFTSILVKND